MKIFRYFMLLVFLGMFYSCAHQVRPSGGEKDTVPPQIINASPEHEELNVTTNEIRLEFDEFVRINASNIIVTPSLSKPLLSKMKAKTVVLSFQDELEENTTYSIQFANSITDVNEGNVLAQPTLVFSTGSFIDSLSLSGTVVDYEKGNYAKNVLVGLYEIDESDSVVIEQKPKYFTQTNEQGAFTIGNLKNKAFKVFAIQDDNNSLRWDPEEPLGKLSPILISDSIQPVKIQINTQQKITHNISEVSLKQNGLIEWKSTERNMKEQVKLITPTSSRMLYLNEPTLDMHQLWIDPEIDSLELEITSNSRVDTFYLEATNDILEPFAPIGKGLSKTSVQNQNPSKPWIIKFNHPIQAIDQSHLIIVDTDSLQIDPAVSVSNDSLIVNVEWKNDMTYRMKLFPQCLTDWYGQTNDTLEFQCGIKPEDAYGNLEIRLFGYQKLGSMGVIEISNEQGQLIHNEAVTDSVMLISNLEAGKYALSVYEDANQNGVWDSGSILLAINAEARYHYSELIQVRGNWDVNVEINVQKP